MHIGNFCFVDTVATVKPTSFLLLFLFFGAYHMCTVHVLMFFVVSILTIRNYITCPFLLGVHKYFVDAFTVFFVGSLNLQFFI